MKRVSPRWSTTAKRGVGQPESGRREAPRWDERRVHAIMTISKSDIMGLQPLYWCRTTVVPTGVPVCRDPRPEALESRGAPRGGHGWGSAPFCPIHSRGYTTRCGEPIEDAVKQVKTIWVYAFVRWTRCRCNYFIMCRRISM